MKYFRKNNVKDAAPATAIAGGGLPLPDGINEGAVDRAADAAHEGQEKNMVWVGRMVALVAIVLAIIFEWKDFLGISGEGGFTFIQKYTGFISPGVFAMFILGMFWKRTTGTAAVVGVILGLVLAIFFNNYAPTVLGHETFLYTAYPTQEMVHGTLQTVLR